MAKETAEQRLLKLIEQTDAQSAPQTSAPVDNAGSAQAQMTLAAVKGPGFSVSGGDLLNKIIFFTRALLSGGEVSPAQGFGLREVNTLVLMGVLLVAAFAVSDIIKGMNESKRELPFGPATVAAVKNPVESLIGTLLPPFRDFKIYSDAIVRRNIFQPIETKEPEKPVEAAPVAGDAKVKEAVSKLKLVGVSWNDSGDTATAMIEDQGTTMTHFLKTGDQLNGVRIEGITTDSVTFQYEGETTMVKM